MEQILESKVKILNNKKKEWLKTKTQNKTKKPDNQSW